MLEKERDQLRTLLPLIIGILIGGSVGMASVMMLITRIQSIPSLVSSFAEHQVQTDTLKQKLVTLQSLNTQELKTLLTQTELAVPVNKDIGGILAALDILGTTTGVEIRGTNLTPGLVSTVSATETTETTNVLPDIKSQKLSLSLAGSVETTINFIDTLTKSRRLIGIDSVNLDFSASDGVVITGIEAVAYYAPIAEISPSFTSSIEPMTSAERNLIQKINNYPLLSNLGDVSAPPSDNQRNDYFR